MDYNQDFAINRLHVLDDTNVTCDKNACAVFNGGIYVEKDIHARNIHIRDFKNKYICSKNADISNANIDILNTNTINVSHNILPTDSLNTSTIGTCELKWNAIHAVNGFFQVVNTNTSNVKNFKYENLTTIPCVHNIHPSFDPTRNYTVQLDKDIIFINIFNIDAYDTCSLIMIKIPDSTVHYEHHKIVLNQINKYKICWSIPGNHEFISNHNTQIFDIVNIPHIKWKIINYSPQNYNHCNCDDDYSSDSESCCSDEDIYKPKVIQDLSNNVVKKTFIKYIYKQDLQDNTQFDELKDIIDTLNEKISSQEEDIDKLNCKLSSNETLIKKMEKIDSINVKKTDDINSSIDNLVKMVKKNDKKIEDLEEKISSINGKLKKIIKYLNLN